MTVSSSMREGQQMAIFDARTPRRKGFLTAAMGTGQSARGEVEHECSSASFRPEQVRDLILLLIIIFAVMLFFGTQIENYFSPRFFNRIATSVAIVAVVAVGQTLVVLTRNIDLSVGSIVGFTAYFVGTATGQQQRDAAASRRGHGDGPGRRLGALNGLLVAYGRVPAIITTLGTLGDLPHLPRRVFRRQDGHDRSLPEWLVNLPQAYALFNWASWIFAC